MNKNPAVIPEIINQFDLSFSQIRNDSNLLGASNDIEAITIWLREYQDNYNTLTSYRQCAERFYLWLYYRGKQLSNITREDIQNYQDFLVDPQPRELWCGKRMPKGPEWKPFVGGLSTASIRLQLWILKNLYNYLVAADYLVKNPFLLIKKMPKPIDKGIDRVLSKQHIDYILGYINQMPTDSYVQEFDKEQAHWLVRLLFLSGMRISEITGSVARLTYSVIH